MSSLGGPNIKKRGGKNIEQLKINDKKLWWVIVVGIGKTVAWNIKMYF